MVLGWGSIESIAMSFDVPALVPILPFDIDCLPNSSNSYYTAMEVSNWQIHGSAAVKTSSHPRLEI